MDTKSQKANRSNDVKVKPAQAEPDMTPNSFSKAPRDGEKLDDILKEWEARDKAKRKLDSRMFRSFETLDTRG